jgi:uncharacterized protein
MMLLLRYVPVLAMLFGHLALWTWVYNRLHASPLPSRRVQQLEKWVILALPVSALLLIRQVLMDAAAEGPPAVPGGILFLWSILCWSMLAYVVAGWTVRQIARHPIPALVTNHTVRLDFRADAERMVGDRVTHLLARIPGNQILDVHVQHKVLAMDRLPDSLDGLRIAHLSDLHMTGQLTRAFFDAIVDHTNRWEADLVAITGDVVDLPPCVDWIPATLGRLRGRDGVYVILGNHDQRLEHVDRLRQTLTDAGLVDLGGRALLRSVRGPRVVLAGNEFPWFPRCAELPAVDRDDTLRDEPGGGPFSVLLSHSPDELPWARARQFDLMLAGHTHGGQIRLPIVGPVICPSRYGVRYASGLFEAPPTLLHVSRGLSGVHPLRFRCPPELTLLELRRRRRA